MAKTNFKKLAREVLTEKASSKVREELESNGFSPFEYDSKGNDFLPYGLKLAQDGSVQAFFDIVKDELQSYAWAFKPTSEEFAQEALKAFEETKNAKSVSGRLANAKAKLRLVLTLSFQEQLNDDSFEAAQEAFLLWESVKADELKAINAKIAKAQ